MSSPRAEIDISDILLRESILALGLSSPNPPVGSYFFGTDLKGFPLEISSHTQPPGKNHAEREGFKIWDSRSGSDHIDAIFVSLEPCTHFGKTPPCRDLILKRPPKILKVGSSDPNPLVSYQRKESLAAYKDKGIEFSFSKDIHLHTRIALRGFFQRIEKNRPRIIFKTALSSEGFFASTGSERIQISSEESVPALQFLRAKVDTILVGPGTIASDFPNLNFRIPGPFLSQLDRESSSSEINPHSVSFGETGGSQIGDDHNLRENRPYFESLGIQLWEENRSRFITRIQSDSISNFDFEFFKFWKTYFELTESDLVWKYHLHRAKEYQPFPSAVLGKKDKKTEDWIKSQLNRLKNQSPHLFLNLYILPSTNWANWFQSEFGISLDIDSQVHEESINKNRLRISPLPEKNWGEFVLQDLGGLGCNLVMIEGGNLLYSEFGKSLLPDDEIISVQNPNSYLGEGIQPAWKTLLEENQCWMNLSFKVGFDHWNIYRRI